MERRCDILTCISIVHSLFLWISKPSLPATVISIYAALILECLFVLVYTRKADKLKDFMRYRPNVDPNLMCVFLVPLCLINELPTSKSGFDIAQVNIGIISVIICKYFFLLGKEQVPALILSAVVSVLVLSFVQTSFCLLYGLAAFFIWKSLDWIPEMTTMSFSFAEISICLQLSISFLGRAFEQALKPKDELQDETQLKRIGGVAVTAIVMATTVTWILRAFRSILSVLCVYSIFALVSLIFLTQFFNENLILWIWKSVQGNCNLLMLLLSWVLCIGITVIWTLSRALQTPYIENNDPHCDENLRRGQHTSLENTSLSCERRYTQHESEESPVRITTTEYLSVHTQASGSRVSLMTRKVFHLFILLVYVPGLLIAPDFLFLASVLAFGAFIIIEALRVFQVPGLGDHIDRILRTFVDDRDQGVLFLTHFYLLIGLSVPLWMTHSSLREVPSQIKLYSGVLSLGIGDTMACVGGRAFGRHHWKGTKKTFEGTLCSCLTQMGFIYIITYLGWLPVYNHINVLVGVVCAALYEAFTDQIDNLVLPLVLFPFLCAS